MYAIRSYYARLETEKNLSHAAVSVGGSPVLERDILETWGAWYDAALGAMKDIEVGGSSPQTLDTIDRARADVSKVLTSDVSSLSD